MFLRSIGSVMLVAGLLALEGCAYYLPAPSPPSQQRLRIVAKDPSVYVVRADFGHGVDYPVPASGEVSLGIPPRQGSCRVYLFNLIPVGGGGDSSKTWSISVASAGATVRKLSLAEVANLTVDPEGYHLLKIAD